MRTESVLLILVLVAAFGLLLLRSRRSPGWACLLTLGSAALVYAGARSFESRQQQRTQARDEIEEKLPRPHRSEGYVSSDQCRSCHPSQYESWHESFHRTMTQEASPSSVLGDFDNVKLEVDGEPLLLQRRADEFWVEMIDPDWKHDQAKAKAGFPGFKQRDPVSAPRVWKRIAMLTGSHHFQAYWVPSMFGNVQFAFPFAWLIPEKRWVPRKDTFIRDPRLPSPIQNWNFNCIQCHSTAGQTRQDTTTQIVQTRVGELGIACESCHGPAEQHVKVNQNPVRRYQLHGATQADPTIVNPNRQAAKASSEICGQCHSIKWIKDQTNWVQHGFSYRPGGDLQATTPVIRPAEFESQTWLPAALKSNQEFLEGIFWPDGKIRVTGREYNGLLDTLCHTKGDLTCLSCHSIHQSRPNDQLAKGMDGNQACLQCHKEQRENLSAHTHHDPNSSGSLCYNCHMPYATYGLLKSIRNHYIDSPSAQTTHNVGRPNACNLCHLDQTLSWTAEHLTEWYRSAAVELNADERTVSASLHMLLKGNAAQRALMASALGWDAARAASGEHWLAYYLCQSLDDPYSAVRLIAYRSLATFPGFEGFKFDYISSPEERDRARKEAFERWGRRKPDRGSSAILMETNGTVRHDLIQKLLLERDNRSLDLIE